MLERRIFLRHLTGLAIACAAVSVIVPSALAKDGGHDGGHDGHDDNGGDDNGRNGADGLNQDEALRELKSGRIIPLRAALKIIDTRVSGKVIDVKLTRSLGRPQYRIKVRAVDGAITTIRLDAKTGKFVGLLGF